MKDNISTIQKVFGSLEKDLISFLEEIAVIKEIPANEILIQPGKFLKHTLLLLSGSIKVYREYDDGGEAFLYFLNPGNACALSMLCIANHKKSEMLAITEEECVVLLIPVQYTDELTKYASWNKFVIETYRKRFEELLEVFDNTVFKAMDERLEFYLKRQTQKNKSNIIELTHQEIATDLSTSREVISRLLKKLEQQGKLSLNRKAIELLKH